jgi:hypothetical protein
MEPEQINDEILKKKGLSGGQGRSQGRISRKRKH